MSNVRFASHHSSAHMLILTLAFGVLLAHLFPLTTILYNATGIVLGGGLRPGAAYLVTWVLNYGPALALAWWSLNQLGIPRIAERLPRGRGLATTGVVAYVVYFALSTGGLLMSAIPYGGGFSIRLLGLLLVIAQALLFAGLFVAVCKEIPVARARDVEG